MMLAGDKSRVTSILLRGLPDWIPVDDDSFRIQMWLLSNQEGRKSVEGFLFTSRSAPYRGPIDSIVAIREGWFADDGTYLDERPV
jgi:hypothetical protein